MAYNGSGTFNITTAGQPVVTGTVISSTAFNALTADLATGLSTAITKDGQTTTTARIVFAQGVSSTLVTDATSATTGSIITAGGISAQKALWVGTTATIAGATTMAGITATSLALGGATLGTNALAVTGTTLLNSALTYGGVTLSNAVTGTGSMVLSTSPQFATSVGIGMTPSNVLDITQSTSSLAVGKILNSNAGTGSGSGWHLANGTANARYGLLGHSYTDSGVFVHDRSYIYNDVAGCSIAVTGPIAFSTDAYTEIARFDTSGRLGIGMTPSNVLDITKTQNSTSTAAIKNASTGTGGAAAYTVFNSSHQATFQLNSTGYSPAGALAADQLYLQTDGAGGILTVSETGPIVWATGGYPFTERARIGTDGSFLIGNTTNAGAGNLSVSGVVHRTKGNSGAIANNATFNITLPTSNGTFILTLNTNSNATQPAVYIVASDGSISTATVVINVGGFCSAIGVASGNIITAKNTSGGTATVYWALLQTLVNA
jgi:hypothetical protein